MTIKKGKTVEINGKKYKPTTKKQIQHVKSLLDKTPNGKLTSVQKPITTEQKLPIPIYNNTEAMPASVTSKLNGHLDFLLELQSGQAFKTRDAVKYLYEKFPQDFTKVTANSAVWGFIYAKTRGTSPKFQQVKQNTKGDTLKGTFVKL